MTGNERREGIKKDLMKSLKAIKGSDIAKKYGVSRQVIVQDIALLRANGEQIISTADGYIYFSFHMNLPKRVFKVKHDVESTKEELSVIVDNGGSVLNIFVDHPIYGDLVVDMVINDQEKIDDYVNKMTIEKAQPLMSLTNNVHYHTVEAQTEEELDTIESQLEIEGFLVSVSQLLA